MRVNSVLEEERLTDPPVISELWLSLEEIYHGCRKKMKISRKEVDEVDNTYSMREKILTIDVRPGWAPGTRITFTREGNQGPNHIPADVVFIVRDRPHARYHREGVNLVHKIVMPLGQALTGFILNIFTLDDRTIHIPIHDTIRPGYSKVIPGEGMPYAQDPTRKGNLLLRFDIEFPKTLTSQQKNLISQALVQH